MWVRHEKQFAKMHKNAQRTIEKAYTSLRPVGIGRRFYVKNLLQWPSEVDGGNVELVDVFDATRK